VLAAITTFYRITGQSLWADEGNSAAQAMRPLHELIRRAAMDIHPPLYYLLLHAWTRVFGTSELGLRSLSAVAGIAVVLLVWAIARRLWGQTTARVAAVIAATHPFLVYYAQEARMYIFVALWASLAGYALIRIILREGHARLSLPDVPRKGNVSLVTRPVQISATHPALLLGKWDGVYILAVAAGLWTHYAFPVLPAVLGVLYLGWVYSTRRTLPLLPRLTRFLTDHLAALLLYVPWVSVALHQVRSWPRPKDVLSLQAGLSVAFQWLALGPLSQASPARWVWLWVALMVVALWPWRRSTPQGYRRPHWLSWGLPLAWMAAPLALMAVLRLFRPAYLKFFILGLPPFIILTVRGMVAPWEAWQHQKRRWPRIVAALWLMVTLFLVLSLHGRTLIMYYTSPWAARDDYRGLVRYIEAIATPQDAIILDAPGQWDVFCYYYAGCDPLQNMAQPAQARLDLPPVYALPLERPPRREQVVARLEQIAHQHAKLFVLLWATDESDPKTSWNPGWTPIRTKP